MESGDDLARLRAQMDQAREGMKELAGNLRSFYTGLCEEGFTEAEALKLTGEFIHGMLRPLGQQQSD